MGSISSSDMTEEVQSIRNETRSINGISDQFVTDIDAILGKFQNNEFVIMALKGYVRVVLDLLDFFQKISCNFPYSIFTDELVS